MWFGSLQLKRCSPHQLRHCSERERLLAASSGVVTAPWSFASLMSRVEAGQYETFDDLDDEENIPKRELLEARPKRSRPRPRQERKERQV